ncbi:MAG: hypothetical protein Ct9H90mP13_11170 [Pseudomonadota bacterium]|nr:MAG: hypothetical protein Ct9H90mP13_11170 [Pseudomonadota bacterium]
MSRESRIEKSDRARSRRKTVREIRKKLLKRLYAHNKHLREKTKKKQKKTGSLILFYSRSSFLKLSPKAFCFSSFQTQ